LLVFRHAPSHVARDAGFTIIEVMVVMAISVTVLSLSLGGFSSALDTVRGDASMNKVLWQLKLARETAINQRRSVEVRFTPPNFMAVVRRNIPNGETVVSTAVLEHSTSFVVFPAFPDTPDGFGNAAAIDFGGAAAVMFNAEGQLVDETGALTNGTIFIGRIGAPLTARALTVFGPTSSIRTFRWNGSQWRN
jgi:prepilin-type N-terminal cleavage/methylation domain-containing protein